MASKLSELGEKYRTFVINNHGLVGNIESGIRILSYFTPGKGEHTAVLSELLYSASNLLVFLNDAILRQAYNVKLNVALPDGELCSWLSVLEHIEVFVEIAGHGLGGDPVRWLAVVLVQVAKAAIKLVLLLKYRSGVQPTPPIPPLKRNQLSNKLPQNTGPHNNPVSDVRSLLADQDIDSDTDQLTSVSRTFTLPRSGRSVRTLHNAPPLLERQWQVPVDSHTEDSTWSTKLTSSQTMGEILHIIRPLSHLFSMYVFGRNSWKPWLVAGGMDTSSLYLLGDRRGYNRAECDEIRRRQILLVLYMLRSPCYDRFTKTRLLEVLQFLAAYIPGARLVIRPLLDYLPWWQRIYFYVWMN